MGGVRVSNRTCKPWLLFCGVWKKSLDETFYKNKSTPTQCNGVRQWEESVVIVVESIVQFVLRGLQFA